MNPFLLPPKMVDDEGALAIHPMLESTAGGFAATPRDLVRWAKALFEARALPADAVAEMTRNPVATEDGRRYGLGLYRLRDAARSRVGPRRILPGLSLGLAVLPGLEDRRGRAGEPRLAADVDALMLEIAQRVRRELQRQRSAYEFSSSSGGGAAPSPDGSGAGAGACSAGARRRGARELGLGGRDADPERGEARHHHLIERHAEHAAVLAARAARSGRS